MDQIKIVNYADKFLAFYEAAIKENADGERRWELWNEHYGFAAVPPGEQGREIARKLLEEAWPKYPSIIERIKNWDPKVEGIQKVLIKVKETVEYTESISLGVLYYVGGLERNAFVAPGEGGQIFVCLPIEEDDVDIILAHELTHIVHAKKANHTPNWERNIASTVLMEGIAIHVSQLLVPGRPVEEYIEHKPNWLQQCYRKKHSIIGGIFNHLSESDSEAVYRFTMGEGTTGIDREAYFAGWELVDFALKNGHTLSEIAEIAEKDAPVFVEKLILKYLEEMLV